MTNREARTYIEEAAKKGSVYGLEPIKNLLNLLGNPEKKIKFIHVAGTNGKGSVSTYIAAILSKKGEKVGRYLSPAVFSYYEIIQLIDKNQSRCMNEDEYSEGIENIANAVEQMKKKKLAIPTAFEMETALAFLLFEKWKVDFAVVECGLGGKIDATNVIDNVAAVITPISIDHTGILGNTIEEISENKAGIIKNSDCYTLQENEFRESIISVLRKECKQKQVDFHVTDLKETEIIESSVKGNVFKYRGRRFNIANAGTFQVGNACLAIDVCEGLGFEILEKDLADAVWPGRLQMIRENPCVILDGAHNKDAAKVLASSIQTLLKGKRVYGVFGVFKDKEYDEIAKIILPLLEGVIVTRAKGERALEPAKLLEVAKKYNKHCDMMESPENAVEVLTKKIEKEDVILVFGTLSFLEEVCLAI